jgi:molybdate transport system ATP-binding protein
LNTIVLELRGAETAPFFAGASWTFRRGEQWIVTGPNGSGKSCLAALLAGEIPLRGIGLTFGEGIEERVAVVTFAQQQEQVARGWLQCRWHWQEDGDAVTVRRFLSYDAVNEINPFEVRDDDRAGRRAFRRRAREVAGLFDTAPLLDRLMVQLSNGEMRRTLLARALLKRPGLLVLDDPFAGLDPAMRERLKAALDQLARDGLPMVLMVRHEDEIPACATHRLTLKAGLAFGRSRVCRHGSGQCRKSPSRTPGVSAAVSEKPLYQARGEAEAGAEADAEAEAGAGAEAGAVAGAGAGAGAGAVAEGVGRARRASRRDEFPPPVIELRGVTVRYGRRVVLDRLDWTVLAGERWVVAGPNGSGKTTLLSLITGDNPAAYANDVRVFGHPRAVGESLWTIRRRIGQVSPELQCYFDGAVPCLDAVLSGRTNEQGEPVRPTRGAREAARAWLHALGLDGLERAPFGALSAGRQRLVLLARAMLPEPDLLLLDEPCLNLDDASRRLVLRVLERLLERRGTETVICVAHRAGDVPRGFGRTLRLGKRVEGGA